MNSLPESTMSNRYNPTSSEIVEWFLREEFGEVDPNKSYPVQNFLSVIFKILVNKHRDNQVSRGSFNQQLFETLIHQKAKGGPENGKTN
jgi:hypothetical protein